MHATYVHRHSRRGSSFRSTCSGSMQSVQQSQQVQGDTCIACLYRFSHKPALHNHIFNRSKKCKDWYLAYAEMVDSKLVEAEIEEDNIEKVANLKKGKAKYGITRRCGQLEGPIPLGASRSWDNKCCSNAGPNASERPSRIFPRVWQCGVSFYTPTW